MITVRGAVQRSMRDGSRMNLLSRLLRLVSLASIALVAVGGTGLCCMRQSMFDGKRQEIANLLQMAEQLASYYHDEELSGGLSQDAAQTTTRLALSAQHVTQEPRYRPIDRRPYFFKMSFRKFLSTAA